MLNDFKNRNYMSEMILATFVEISNIIKHRRITNLLLHDTKSPLLQVVYYKDLFSVHQQHNNLKK